MSALAVIFMIAAAVLFFLIGFPTVIASAASIVPMLVEKKICHIIAIVGVVWSLLALIVCGGGLAAAMYNDCVANNPGASSFCQVQPLFNTSIQPVGTTGTLEVDQGLRAGYWCVLVGMLVAIGAVIVAFVMGKLSDGEVKAPKPPKEKKVKAEETPAAAVVTVPTPAVEVAGEVRFCGVCGTKATTDDKFCGKCGAAS